MQVENDGRTKLHHKDGVGPLAVAKLLKYTPAQEEVVELDGDPQTMWPVALCPIQRMRASVKKSNNSKRKNECDTDGDVLKNCDTALRSAA